MVAHCGQNVCSLCIVSGRAFGVSSLDLQHPPLNLWQCLFASSAASMATPSVPGAAIAALTPLGPFAVVCATLHGLSRTPSHCTDVSQNAMLCGLQSQQPPGIPCGFHPISSGFRHVSRSSFCMFLFTGASPTWRCTPALRGSTVWSRAGGTVLLNIIHTARTPSHCALTCLVCLVSIEAQTQYGCLCAIPLHGLPATSVSSACFMAAVARHNCEAAVVALLM